MNIRQTIDDLGHQGCELLASGKLEEAVEALARAFRMHAGEYGDGHPEGLSILLPIATALGLQGKCDEACEISDMVIEAAGRLDPGVWGETTPVSFLTLAQMQKARVLTAAGKHAAASVAIAEVSRTRTQTPRLPSDLELHALVTQAQCAFSLGDAGNAVIFARTALAALRTASLDLPVMVSRCREVAQLLSAVEDGSPEAHLAWSMATTAAAKLPEDNILKLYIELDTANRDIRASPAQSVAALQRLEERVIKVFGRGHPTHQSVQANLADALSRLGQHDDAVSVLRTIHEQAQAAKSVEAPVGRWVLRDLGLGLVRQKNYAGATPLLEQWIRLTDINRATAGDATMRSFQSTSLGFERAGVALAVCRVKTGHEVAAVFEAIERTSARGVADLVSQNGTGLPQLAIDARRSGRWTAEQTEEFLRLAKRCEEADAALRAAERSRGPADANAALSGLLDAETLIRPMVAELVPIGEPPTLDEVRDALEPGETLLQVADSADSMLVLTVSGGRGVTPRCHILIEHDERSIAELRGDVRAIMRHACGDETLARARRAASRIVNTVFAPEVRSAIAGSERLVVAFGGALRVLSIDMLGELANDAELTTKITTYVPSASTLTFLRKKAAGRPARSISLGAVGDVAYGRASPGIDGSGPMAAPPLPRSASEIADAVRLFGRARPREIAVATEQDATEPRIREVLRGKSFIHIATHGTRAEAYDRQGSALVCAPSDHGDIITLQSLLTSWGGELREAELVVLSACWTDSTAAISSDAFSLSLGFLHAGARYVLASPIPVPDLPTWLLMRRFYELLLCGAGEDAASVAARAPEALAHAKAWLAGLSAAELRGLLDKAPLPERYRETQNAESLWLRELAADHRPFADPRRWAGFRLIGG